MERVALVLPVSVTEEVGDLVLVEDLEPVAELVMVAVVVTEVVVVRDSFPEAEEEGLIVPVRDVVAEGVEPAEEVVVRDTETVADVEPEAVRAADSDGLLVELPVGLGDAV